MSEKASFKSKSTIRHVYDEIAEHFDATRYKPWPETMKFAEKLKRDSRVLDIGCGNGRNSRYLASKGMKVTGIDFSPAQILIARNRAEEETPDAGIELGAADATDLPFGDGVFDAVLYIATFHHLPDADQRSKSLAEIYRVLRAGGVVLLSAWSREQDKFAANLEAAKDELGPEWEEGDMRLPWNRPDGKVFQRYYHLFSETEFNELLASSKFRILNVYNSCDNWYALLKK